ncbi:MAG: hypothetical protein D6834_01270 [Aquificota bacterium]|nr:MAG: hypothetical protein D6834_01270 [Aquificota bacterium]
MTFLIDIPVEEGLKRIKKERATDRIEQENIEFHKRLREGFLKIAEENKSRIHIINGLKNPDEIFNDILKILSCNISSVL